MKSLWGGKKITCESKWMGKFVMEVREWTGISSHPRVVCIWQTFPSGYKEPCRVKIIPREHEINVLWCSEKERATGDFLIDDFFIVVNFKVSPERSDDVSANVRIGTDLFERLRETQHTVRTQLNTETGRKKDTTKTRKHWVFGYTCIVEFFFFFFWPHWKITVYLFLSDGFLTYIVYSEDPKYWNGRWSGIWEELPLFSKRSTSVPCQYG